MPDLRAIAHASLLTASPLERYQGASARRVEDGVVILVSGEVSGPEANYVTVIGPVTLQRLFDLAGDFYDGGAYAVVIDVEHAPLVDEALHAGGWALDEEEPLLVLTPIPASPPTPPTLDICRVATQQALDDFFAITETPRHYIPSLAAARDPDVALFVGYLDGQPVATSRLSCLREVGDVNGVVTADAFRRRGIGTALTWAAIDAARQHGCTAITLTATEMGLPVYERMGFTHACTLRTYVQPTAAGPTA